MIKIILLILMFHSINTYAFEINNIVKFSNLNVSAHKQKDKSFIINNESLKKLALSDNKNKNKKTNRNQHG